MSGKTNIEFEHLRYSVRHEIFNKSEKAILKNVNGEFRGCELSAILGPSGSGKTSLINILSGFVTKNVFGSIRINGEDRHDDLLKKQSTYIMQDDNLHSMLTVNEAMSFAVKLKTGNVLTADGREAKIVSILSTLGLSGKANDYSADLSGGERKRLSIALELVNDPAILFLDEPTTGLDSSSSTQCIQLLKKLAKEGKTIICTIHTPSALLFELFDHVYALADGCCIYQGSSHNLVPFLNELDLVCPEIYNPADFLLEIATNSYGSQNNRLMKKISNGLNGQYRQADIDNNNCAATFRHDHKTSAVIRQSHQTSFALQFTQMMLRNFLFLTRDKMYLLMRLMVHLSVGLMIGLIYYDIGQEATEIFNVYRFIPIAIGFLAYSGFYSLMIRIPLEMPITKREHFNGWYSSISYYLALFLSDLPITIVCSTVYVILIYVMTNQPLEAFRLLNVIFVAILTCLSAQAYGILIGSLFNVQIALTVAALLMATHILFGGCFILVKDVSKVFHWVFETTYIKQSLDGFASLVLGYDRAKLHCSDSYYCHFQSPRKFMDFIGLQEDLPKVFLTLIGTILVLHVAAYSVIRYRLRN